MHAPRPGHKQFKPVQKLLCQNTINKLSLMIRTIVCRIFLHPKDYVRILKVCKKVLIFNCTSIRSPYTRHNVSHIVCVNKYGGLKMRTYSCTVYHYIFFQGETVSKGNVYYRLFFSTVVGHHLPARGCPRVEF